MQALPLASAARKAIPRRLSFNLQEASGALGDIGVLVPIVATLIVSNGFNPTAVLLVFGLTYIGSGLYYRLPMPVQPLKAMAAIAIAQGLSAEVVSAGGFLMGLILLTLAVTGAIRPVASLFPRPVIRGIQAAVGLLLVQAGFRLWFNPQVIGNGADIFVRVAGLAIPAGALMAAGLGAVLLLTLWNRRLPATLLVLVPALAIGAMAGSFAALGNLQFGPNLPRWGLPQGSHLATALVVLVVPQLPLTLGNAVIACADTARSYFGEEAGRVSHRALLTSKGLANLVAGLVGGMPVCHGSGGLTAHYKFGARTGGATVMLGVLLLVLALGFGPSTGAVLGLIPYPALGLLLTVVGIQHALLARDSRPGLEWAIVTIVVATALASGNIAIGFGAGIAAYQGARFLPRGYVWVQARFSPPLSGKDGAPSQAQADGDH